MQRCVVIADDDPAIIRLVKLRLGMAHYNVVATSDAVAALAMVRSQEPVAVILDVAMPGGGGVSALNQIKSDPRMARLPVMMLTGERNPETVIEAMNAGAGDYMVKPFNPDMLLERLSRLVKSSAMMWSEPPAATWEL
ncbi:MAG: response regulator [Alphaproteobacteria bacterium]|nr:response regulator [Alphaproteobacteria bacterium]